MTDPTEETPATRFGGRRATIARIRGRARGAGPFAAGIAASLVALLLYGALVPGPAPLTTTDVSNTVTQVLASQTPGPAVSQLVYQAVRPAIVLIEVEAPDADGKDEAGLGTGVVIDQQGDILTALHVIANATAIKLTFADGTTSAATVMAQKPETDIAVLRADTPPATIEPATLGNPNVPIGSDAYVVGNPFGLYGSMSAGIVSGLNRSFQFPGTERVVTGLIQVDAAVNPGNSGGPLLNRAGQVIGIVTGLLNPSNQNFFIGIGLAVPIDVAGGAAGLPQF